MSSHQHLAAVDEFRHEVIHKLSQPVTALQGSLEVALLVKPSGDAYRRAIEVASEQAMRMAMHLQDLRDKTWDVRDASVVVGLDRSFDPFSCAPRVLVFVRKNAAPGRRRGLERFEAHAAPPKWWLEMDTF
jgi:signal transduction histidine kinase